MTKGRSPKSEVRRPLTSADDLTVDPANANLGTDRGAGMLDESIAEVGAGRAIVADRRGVVLAGNKTLQGWKKANGRVRFVETSGDELVVVVRSDLDLAADPLKARRLAYYDNRVAEVNLRWDHERIVLDAQAGIDVSRFFTGTEYSAILRELQNAGKLPTQPEADAAPAEPKATTIKPGDVFALGPHRLMCGDALKADDLVALLDGVPRVHAIQTDPPYGTASSSKVQKRGNRIETFDLAWDKAAPLGWIAPAVEWLEPGGAVLAFFDNKLMTDLWRALEAEGVRPLQTVYWEKPIAPQPRPNFCSCIESAVFGRKTGGKVVAWHGGGATPNIFRASRAAGGERTEHETQKPMALWEPLLRLVTSPGMAVLDPFVGSGTTIIAAERSDRVAYGLDNRPLAVQWALDRWEQYAGKKAVQVAGRSRTRNRPGDKPTTRRS